MPKFVLGSVFDEDANPFDRQERMEWWKQESLRTAKIMVLGAGAIGNEVLKNLALLGVGNIFVADFDIIAPSNLSRTVLFRRSDVGARKAEIAAMRTRELCLEDQAEVSWFHGDMVWELGNGVYREMDLVLGCLDNIEARRSANRQSWLAQRPWIDAGIQELGARVDTYAAAEPPCYECTLSATQIAAGRSRYSCDNFKREYYSADRVPTTQIASALVAAVQVQEAVKLLCGTVPTLGKRIYFQGSVNDFDLIGRPARQGCPVHALSYPAVREIPIGRNVALRTFLEFVSQPHLSGPGAVLDFRGDREFVVSVECRTCHVAIELLRPSFRILDSETICDACRALGRTVEHTTSEHPVGKLTLPEFSLDVTETRILDMTLEQIGVPLMHIAAVLDVRGSHSYYELVADREQIFPKFPTRGH